MNREWRIFVAGHGGMAGSAIVRKLKHERFDNLVLRTREELDLIDQRAVNDFFASESIDCVIHAAGLVGGIVANNSRQADFLYENLMVATNVIHAASRHAVQKLLFLGSSCIYPKHARQPIAESELLTGPLEPTNEAYAIAKIAGLKLCEKYRLQYGKHFISAMPTNLYGPNDNFHPTSSHVIPGLMRRFHEAKQSGAEEVVVWGSGRPMREFLHVDDLADALFVLLERYDEASTINVGTGRDETIAELAQQMKEVTRYDGRIIFDTSQPDGTPRKMLDISRIQALGWSPRIRLRDGLAETYRWAVEHGAL